MVIASSAILSPSHRPLRGVDRRHLGLVALALALFYTAPPLNLGAKGLGELDVGISFTMMAFFSFFVLAQEFDLTVLVLSIGIGISMMMVRLCDEAPGHHAHVRLGEKNLVVRVGLDDLPKLIGLLGVLFYSTALLAAALNVLFLALLLTVPLFLKVMKLMSDRDDDLRFWRSIPQMLKTAVSNQILIILILILQSVWTSV